MSVLAELYRASLALLTDLWWMTIQASLHELMTGRILEARGVRGSARAKARGSGGVQA